MDKWLSFVSVIASFATLLGFVGIFIKLGREKGESDAIIREVRKDVDTNAKDINSLGQKVNQMQIENTRLISTLSSDLGWIKSSLADIKSEISKGKEK
jgi:hypothetical protein